ncbi:MAG: rod shape-determining protein MreC [Thermaerobacter sp.]|nr:rod shape-determining protein MreC [Thermaerobacter sp.]
MEFKHGRLLLIGAAALALIVLLSLTAREKTPGPLSTAAQEALAPLQGGIQTVSGAVYHAVGFVAGLGTTERQNQALRRQLAGVGSLQAQVQTLRSQKRSLETLLGLVRAHPRRRYLAARVIGRNPSQWFDTLTLDRGAASGVARNQPVVTAAGVVGRVISVTAHTATVLLLTSDDSGAGATVAQTGETGVVEGVPGKAELQMKFFGREAKVKVGDTVVTSGISTIYPAGLLIGRVVKTGYQEYGLVRYAVLRPAVSFNRLEYVLVQEG